MKKNTKKTEPTNDAVAEIKEEFKRHTNILMEQMRHEVKTVAEGHGIIIKKLEKHDEKFEQIGHKLEEHDEKFYRIEHKLEEQDKKFIKIESELNSISMAVMDTSERAKAIEKKIDGHENRITKVEEKVFV